MDWFEIIGAFAIALVVAVVVSLFFMYRHVEKHGVSVDISAVSLNLFKLLEHGKIGNFVIFSMKDQNKFLQFRNNQIGECQTNVIELAVPENVVTESYFPKIIKLAETEEITINRIKEQHGDKIMYFNYINFGDDVKIASKFCELVFVSIFDLEKNEKISIQSVYYN